MPRFGIGTFNVPGDRVAEDAVAYALKCGYRHIDTAHAYRVESAVMQIELHPYAQRTYWQDMAKKYNIQMECWSR